MSGGELVLFGALIATLIGVLILLRRQTHLLSTRAEHNDALQRQLRAAQEENRSANLRAAALSDVLFDGLLLIDKQRHVTLTNPEARAAFRLAEQPTRPLTL